MIASSDANNECPSLSGWMFINGVRVSWRELPRLATQYRIEIASPPYLDAYEDHIFSVPRVKIMTTEIVRNMVRQCIYQRIIAHSEGIKTHEVAKPAVYPRVRWG